MAGTGTGGGSRPPTNLRVELPSEEATDGTLASSPFEQEQQGPAHADGSQPSGSPPQQPYLRNTPSRAKYSPGTLLESTATFIRQVLTPLTRTLGDTVKTSRSSVAPLERAAQDAEYRTRLSMVQEVSEMQEPQASWAAAAAVGMLLNEAGTAGSTAHCGAG
jgi:hypothetical protein